MRTKHQYVTEYPIRKNSKKLILGTIHPHDHEYFKIPYFYGNKLSLWNILNEAFDFELGKEITLEAVLKFLQNRKISVSDTVLECTRKNMTALDKDLKVEILNLDLINQIKDSEINEIFFTSGFGKNNAFKLFYVDILGQKITKKIKEEKGIVLDRTYFGRPVKLTVLMSPSGSANGSISKSKAYLAVKEKYLSFQKPVKQFRIDFYKEKFK